ncbi:MAG: hypothetical protein ACI9DC_004439 [Gammaproteobacteria bacterium]
MKGQKQQPRAARASTTFQSLVSAVQKLSSEPHIKPKQRRCPAHSCIRLPGGSGIAILHRLLALALDARRYQPLAGPAIRVRSPVLNIGFGKAQPEQQAISKGDGGTRDRYRAGRLELRANELFATENRSLRDSIASIGCAESASQTKVLWAWVPNISCIVEVKGTD